MTSLEIRDIIYTHIECIAIKAICYKIDLNTRYLVMHNVKHHINGTRISITVFEEIDE